MKRNRILPFALLTLALLACTCNTLTLPFFSPSATPTIGKGQILTPMPPPAVNTGETPFNLAWDDRSLFLSGLTSTYQDVLGELPGASIYHLAISLSDPPALVSGVEEVHYTNQETVSLSEVDFAVFSEILGGSITIGKTLLDGQPITPAHSTGFLRFSLSTPLDVGKSVIFHIEFDASLPSQGGGAYFGIFGFNNGILSLAQAYPTILVYNQDGWNNQTPDLDGDPLFSDTSFYLVSVDAPADLVLVASGVEVQRSETAGRQRVLYADGPARDFYLAGAQGLVKKSATEGEVTINSYAPVDLDTYSQAALETAQAAIQDYSQRYAPYPYTEFDLVPIVTSAGGVEFPGMTAVAENVYAPGSLLEIVVAHEVAHQWFYNLVGNETQNQPWLDESMAEFLTWQYYLDRYGTSGADSYKQDMQSNWDAINDQTIPIGQPVSVYTFNGYVGIVYGRGPFFLLALRDQIGTATFDRFLRDYVKQYSWNIATTDTFKALAEQDCGCDLTPLFKEWVYP